MFSIRRIIKNNSDTFYNFDTGDKISVSRRIVFFVILSALFSLVLKPQSDSFLSAILAAQSILVGFSFSVLFFLLSNAQIPSLAQASLEKQLVGNKVSILSKELFYNVSYYNLVAISSVVLALLILSSGVGDSIHMILDFMGVLSYFQVSEKVVVWASRVQSFITWLLNLCLYFFLFESIYTFFRTVIRINYFFEKKFQILELNKNVGVN